MKLQKNDLIWADLFPKIFLDRMAKHISSKIITWMGKVPHDYSENTNSVFLGL